MFLLNGIAQEVSQFPSSTTLLDYLRGVCRLTGTKEGCAEGDCGACTVVVGSRGARYRAVNACIQFLPMLEGKAVYTVEGLGGDHPCQNAMARPMASQCGFCTPGFVMSLYAAYLNEAKPSRARINEILAGNLCRCTGYGPIIEAAEAMYDEPRVDAPRIALESPRAMTVDDLAERLIAEPDAVIVAGATDLALRVTKGLEKQDRMIFIGDIESMRRIEIEQDRLVIGAAATYAEIQPVLAEHYSDFAAMLCRLGATQVRNAGTMGGNIANGSPIGDSPPALIALGATLVLRRGAEIRRLAIEDYFLDYGRQDRRPGEFILAIEIPLGRRLRCFKISKRSDQDISILLGCFSIELEGDVVRSARIAFGGMAAIPKRARAAETTLLGRRWTEATIAEAKVALDRDFAPLSDHRGSARYRSAVARNLLTKLFMDL